MLLDGGTFPALGTGFLENKVKNGSPVQVVSYNNQQWFVSGLPEKNISNVVVQCRKYPTITCSGLCLTYMKKISQTW